MKILFLETFTLVSILIRYIKIWETLVYFINDKIKDSIWTKKTMIL